MVISSQPASILKIVEVSLPDPLSNLQPGLQVRLFLPEIEPKSVHFGKKNPFPQKKGKNSKRYLYYLLKPG
jgi:hypothetical protein